MSATSTRKTYKSSLEEETFSHRKDMHDVIDSNLDTSDDGKS